MPDISRAGDEDVAHDVGGCLQVECRVLPPDQVHDESWDQGAQRVAQSGHAWDPGSLFRCEQDVWLKETESV